MIKRFFTKKSVAVILAATFLVGFLPVFNVYAQTNSFNSAIEVMSNLGNSALEVSGINNIQDSAVNSSTETKDRIAGAATFTGFIGFATPLYVIHIILSGFIALAGQLFDYSIEFSIINIKDLFDSTGPLNILWVMIRDLFNISFIFILLYLAITRILGSWGARAKTTVVNVLISAVLINFSMFITKVLIDGGNIVAVELYKQIVGADLHGSISSLIFSKTDFWDVLKNSLKASGQVDIILTLVMQVMCLATLIYVYVYASILFIGRAIMLMFLTVTSPIGFMGDTIPSIGEISKKWWKTLTDQILVAPVLIFFLLLITKIIQSPIISKMLDFQVEIETVLDFKKAFIYMLIIILLLKAMSITKKLSGEVGAFTVNAVQGAIKGAAVAATVATGGLALAGTGAATGIKAFKEGKGFSSSIGAGFKNIGTNLKDFSTGKMGEKSGMVGFASRFARGNIIEGVKSASQGSVDINKIQETLRKNVEEEKKRIEKEAEGQSSKKLSEEKKFVDSAIENITNIAENRLDENIKGFKPKGNGNIDENIEKVEKEKVEKEKILEIHEKTLRTAEQSGDVKASAEARKQRDETLNDIKETDKIITNYKKYKDELNKKINEVGTEMGLPVNDLIKQQKSLVGEISNKNRAYNQFIKNFEEKGNIFLPNKEVKALGRKFRMNQFKNKDIKKALKDFQEQLGIKDEEKEGTPTQDNKK